MPESHLWRVLKKKFFKMTICPIEIWTWYLCQTITTLLAALSAGTNINDFLNSIKLLLILENDICSVRFGIKLFSNFNRADCHLKKLFFQNTPITETHIINKIGGRDRMVVRITTTHAIIVEPSTQRKPSTCRSHWQILSHKVASSAPRYKRDSNSQI
jgi:hypothetical protein